MKNKKRLNTNLLYLSFSAIFTGIFIRLWRKSGGFYNTTTRDWRTFTSGWAILFLILGIHSLIPRRKTSFRTENQEKALTILILVFIIAISCFSMTLSPFWKGEKPECRYLNQYEVMADSLLHGHLYLDYDDIDPALAQMENPYDPEERDRIGVEVHFDHAWYNGHYYMYFGIVPVFLLFIPYKIITGTSLATYHATQIFTSLFIIGLFYIFFRLKKQFFQKISFPTVLLMAAASSLMSTWFIDSQPSLYCTAISAGICCEVWSLFFFIKAVWIETRENRQIAQAFTGSLLGALAFGCRPPVALANLMVIPFLIEYLKKKKETHTLNARLFIKLAVAALPYVIIGALLMAYNYARFGDVFEFGQAYQITAFDQHNYSITHNFDIQKIFRYFYHCLIHPSPYAEHEKLYLGILLQFPILWFCLLGFNPMVRGFLAKKHFLKSVQFMGIIPGIILVAESVFSPGFLERYTMDILWLFCILAFFTIGGMLCSWEGNKLRYAEKVIQVLYGYAVIISILLFLVPNSSNFSFYYYGQIILAIRQLTGLPG